MGSKSPALPRQPRRIEHRVAPPPPRLCAAATEKQVPRDGTAFVGGGDAFLERTGKRKCATPLNVPTPGCRGEGAAYFVFRLPGVGLSLWLSSDGWRRLQALDLLVLVADSAD